MAQNDRSAELQDLVRGRLSPEEAARLSAAVDADPDLKAEHRLLQELNKLDTAEHAFPGEFGWARLSREIDRKPSRNVLRASVPAWQAAAAIAIAVVSWQFVVSPQLAGDGAGPDRYVTATGPGEAVAPGVTARIAFVPTATEAAISTLLREVDARIVDGPSAVGLYTVAFDGEEARSAAVERFGETQTVVDVVTAE